MAKIITLFLILLTLMVSGEETSVSSSTQELETDITAIIESPSGTQLPSKSTEEPVSGTSSSMSFDILCLSWFVVRLEKDLIKHIIITTASQHIFIKFRSMLSNMEGHAVPFDVD